MAAWLAKFFGGPPMRPIYAFIWRMSDRKRFKRGSNGLYAHEDGEYLQLVTSQALERGETNIKGEIYLLSNDPRFTLGGSYPQVPREKKLPGEDGMLRKLDVIERIDRLHTKNP